MSTQSSDEKSVQVQVTVNRRTCMANQMCVKLAADIFRLGEAGYSQVIREVKFADLERLRSAEEACPTGSILVEVEEAS